MGLEGERAGRRGGEMRENWMEGIGHTEGGGRGRRGWEKT